MKIYTIYKITNLINNKSYIGFDCRWPKRKQIHIYQATKYNCQYLLHKAIRKYNI